MQEPTKQDYQDPKRLLQTAIEALDTFTQAHTSRLKVGKDGRLMAAKESRLKKVVGCYIVPFFSHQMRQEREKKLREIKKVILQARDIIKSHSALIEKLIEGDDAQRKLAEYALMAIQRYNAAVVGQGLSSESIKYDVYNYERHQLLLDQEIKGEPIELPHTFSIKYHSHTDAHPAHKTLKGLSQAWLTRPMKKANASVFLTHKKALQCMLDTFHMKSIRLVQSHLAQHHVMPAEILPIIKQTPIEIDDESQDDLITLRQLLEIGPGFHILITGCFKRRPSDPQFMAMPILDSFRLSFQLTHSGFPYPSQHTGWALSDKWIEAYPLRMAQVPLFQQIDQRRKRLAQKLLSDQAFSQKAREYTKRKREVFDQHRAIFLSLHRQLQYALRQDQLTEENEANILDDFYREVSEAPSAFDLLVQTQQQILELFIKYPFKALEEEWLSAESTPLRLGTAQEKFQAACQRLEHYRQQTQSQLNLKSKQQAYILQQGLLLGKAFEPVGLQYQSEKMGFPPPSLNVYERKLQACAFQQLLRFLDEWEEEEKGLDVYQIKHNLLDAWAQDLHLFSTADWEKECASSIMVVNELEKYFNSRYQHSSC